MIPQTYALALLALEAAANKECPLPKKPIPVKGIRLDKSGKVVKTDKAPPHVKARRRRKAGKVTGARAAR